MLILAPYIRMQPETDQALKAYAPTAVRVSTSLTEYSYYWAVRDHWNQGSSLMVVEQDIVITAEVVSSFSSCEQPWCIYEYLGRNNEPFAGALGCTKFSAALQAAVVLESIYSPELCSGAADPRFKEVPGGRTGVPWTQLDSWLKGGLWDRGYRLHKHGTVIHLHDYQAHPSAGGGTYEK